MDVNIISTGSQGNCVIIDNCIMLDAGVTKKKITDTGYDFDNLKMLFVSHKHADHANMPLIRYCITKEHDVIHLLESGHKVKKPELQYQVFLPNDVYQMFRQKELDRKVDPIDVTYMPRNVHLHDKGKVYHLETDEASYTISLHPQKHHDIVNYGFVIEKQVNDKTERLLYVTDLDTIEPTAVGPGLTSLGMFDIIVMEGNYDEIWLRDYITQTMDILDPTIDASTLTDKELDQYVRANYRKIPKEMSAGLFRAVQNMRHLSKQQARAYVKQHLNPGGQYYEVHRSSMFYERPLDWTLLNS